jgi:hypothetical protein
METQTNTGTPKPKLGEMAIMGKEGDTKIIWDKSKRVEVDNARANFDRLIKEGYTAFSVAGDKGDKDKQIRTFDPDAERLIFVPPVQAG